MAAVMGTHVFVFGGFSTTHSDELWQYDISTGTFTLLASERRGLWGPILASTSSAAPVARQKHAMTSAGTRFYLFGGQTAAGMANDLWQYDTTDSTWAFLNANLSSSSPRARWGHAMASVGTRLFVFGGQTGQTTKSLANDLWRYDTIASTWAFLNANISGTLPSARTGHAMTSLGTRLFVFGGETASGFSDEFWEYNEDVDSCWTLVSGSNGPSARSGHAMTTMGIRVFLQGGLLGVNPSRENILSDELWEYDVLARRWTKSEPCGNPRARYGHAMTSVAGFKILVFGGETHLGERNGCRKC